MSHQSVLRQGDGTQSAARQRSLFSNGNSAPLAASIIYQARLRFRGALTRISGKRPEKTHFVQIPMLAKLAQAQGIRQGTWASPSLRLVARLALVLLFACVVFGLFAGRATRAETQKAPAKCFVRVVDELGQKVSRFEVMFQQLGITTTWFSGSNGEALCENLSLYWSGAGENLRLDAPPARAFVVDVLATPPNKTP